MSSKIVTRRLTLPEAVDQFWDYHVESVEKPAAPVLVPLTPDAPAAPAPQFRLLNLSLPDSPMDIQIVVPQDVEVDGCGRPTDPSLPFADCHDHITEALGEGFCAYKTFALFGWFDSLPDNVAPGHPQITHSFVPTDPKNAKHVWIRTIWDYSVDARKIPTASLDPEGCVYQFGYAHWDGSHGAVHYILELKKSSITSDVVDEFQEQMDSVRRWATRRMEEFAAHKNEYRDKLLALSARAEALGWKLVFESPERASLVLRDSEAIRTTYVRYEKAAYENFVRNLERAEAFTTRRIVAEW